MRTVTLILAAVAGFAGGTAASRLEEVHAQGPGAEVLRSRGFMLFDSAGRKRGEWTVDSSDQPRLRMFDRFGRVIWESRGGAQLIR
ncbi:MAG TPA: hypothetical protein VME17_05185 [Bryobacteraceae bacterium]|nr:hypothetical protein [Bryobacteraceae bacterium]